MRSIGTKSAKFYLLWKCNDFHFEFITVPKVSGQAGLATDPADSGQTGLVVNRYGIFYFALYKSREDCVIHFMIMHLKILHRSLRSWLSKNNAPLILNCTGTGQLVEYNRQDDLVLMRFLTAVLLRIIWIHATAI